jgi:homoserine kinase
MGKSIKAFAPATVANVSCGFDVLGLAVESPGDIVTVSLSDTPGVVIKAITGDEGKLPLAADENTVSLVIMQYLKAIGKEELGVEIVLDKGMPLKSGLGSSAASSVVGIYALNKLLDEPLTQLELLPFAMQGELLACGTAHADNVAPALLGGFVFVRSYEPLDVIQLPVPSDLYATIVHPHIEVKTQDARSILKAQIDMSKAITQWGNVGGIVAGLYTNDYDLIGRSLNDVIVEPVRKLLIPGFDQAKSSALAAGALGCSISGSGPSIFALSKGKATAEKVKTAFDNTFNELGISHDIHLSKVNAEGPKIIS